MTELTRKSKYELPGFIMIVVGTEISAAGLWVSLHRPLGCHQKPELAYTQ
jgi:hypothetical protein